MISLEISLHIFIWRLFPSRPPWVSTTHKIKDEISQSILCVSHPLAPMVANSLCCDSRNCALKYSCHVQRPCLSLCWVWPRRRTWCLRRCKERKGAMSTCPPAWAVLSATAKGDATQSWSGSWMSSEAELSCTPQLLMEAPAPSSAFPATIQLPTLSSQLHAPSFVLPALCSQLHTPSSSSQLYTPTPSTQLPALCSQLRTAAALCPKFCEVAALMPTVIFASCLPPGPGPT